MGVVDANRIEIADFLQLESDSATTAGALKPADVEDGGQIRGAAHEAKVLPWYGEIWARIRIVESMSSELEDLKTGLARDFEAHKQHIRHEGLFRCALWDMYQKDLLRLEANADNC